MDPMRRAFTIAAAFLVLVNVVVNQWLPGWLYIPAMAGAGLAVVAFARRAGVSQDDLGLSPLTANRAGAIGLVIGGLAAVAIIAGTFAPGLNDLYLDERAAGIGIGGLLYQALIRIPLGTAVGEELMFRSGLLALGLRTWPQATAIAVVSLLFGVWHVLPTLSAVGGNASVAGQSVVLVVPGAVVLTAAAGAFFCWLRLRTRHVVAPVVVHALVNSTSFIAAYALIG